MPRAAAPGRARARPAAVRATARAPRAPSSRPARPHPPRPSRQGGFARCFKFLYREKNRVLAGKVVDKESLHKARAKSKVRDRAPPRAVPHAAPNRPHPPARAAPQLLAEIKIHRSVCHKNIVGFDTFFEDNTNVYMMLEVCPNQVRAGAAARARARVRCECDSV